MSKTIISITKNNEKSFTFQELDKAPVHLDEKSIVLEKKTGKYWLKLPENTLNRKLVGLNKFEESNVVTLTEDHLKKPVTHTGTSHVSSKLEDFMTEEEKQIIADIKAKAEARREEAKKKATEAKKDPVVKARNRVYNAIEALKALGMSDEAIAKLIKGEQA